jgi:hypothetical protein
MGSKPVSGAIRIRRNPPRYARIWLRRAKRGALAEWLRSGLQSRLHRFDSGRRLRESPAPAGSFLEPTGEIECCEEAMGEVVEYARVGVHRKGAEVQRTQPFAVAEVPPSDDNAPTRTDPDRPAPLASSKSA